jgi:hypothetical protein
MSSLEERMAQNELMFRMANERIEEAASYLDFDELLPIICECERQRCTSIVRVAVDDYRAIRMNPRAFIYAIGHEHGTVTESTVIESNSGGYTVVEKHGVAGEIAEQDAEREAT